MRNEVDAVSFERTIPSKPVQGDPQKDTESVTIDFDLKKQSRAMVEEPRTTANQFTVKCTVRGHHVYMYKRIWTPQAGERLETVCEVDNEHDK